MTVKEIIVTRWETSDGQEFESRRRAEQYESNSPFIVFRHWYGMNCLNMVEANPTGVHCVHEIPARKAFDWVVKNEEVLRTMGIFKDDK